ncbi:MAG TPA: ankyrin repeat domain-containing protein [Stellaceae bacterium]|nr:ankyrin repeat domain-containing protein [Stellaceae bacterium]
MSAQDTRHVTPDHVRGKWLPGAFWIVAIGDVLFLLAALLDAWTNPSGEFAGLVVVLLLALLVIAGVIVGIVALIRNPVAYAIGLALMVWPPLTFGIKSVTEFVTTPSTASLEAGYGYFTGRAERALADAVVAGDGAQVAALVPTANLNAVGWDRMTFMRLALENGHAKPEVVAALLKAGIDPDQDQQYLFGSMNDGSGATSGAMITGQNEPLLSAVIDTGVDLNHQDLEGNPRFFSALRWPEGLAVMLDRGANTEAEGKNGYTAIMYAVMLWYWPSIDVLLAHGAHLDHTAHDGQTLRDLVSEKRERLHGDMPPELTRLEARLH